MRRRKLVRPSRRGCERCAHTQTRCAGLLKGRFTKLRSGRWPIGSRAVGRGRGRRRLLRDAQGYFRALRLSLASRSDARSLVPCLVGYTFLSGWVSVRPLTDLCACCMVVRADSACSLAFTESTPPPACGCVLAVAGTGVRALFCVITHTQSTEA